MRSKARIGDILVEQGAITAEQLTRAIALQGERGGRLGQILIEESLATPVQLLRALAAQFGVDAVDLDDTTVQPEAVQAIPNSLARRHRALPYAWEGDTLVVATANPSDLFALDDIRAYTGAPVRPVMAEASQLADYIARFAREDIAHDPTSGPSGVLAPDSAHVRFVDLVLERAIAERASDIHLEPVAKGLRVRFRVDGVMHDVFTAPRGTEAGVISRLKIIAEMDIAERRLPQDGRCTHTVDNAPVDLRVATLPTMNGESAVIRILDNRATVARLDDLGFLPGNLDVLRAAVRRPWGAILVSGPTGSGKTTTLYGALAELNEPSRNILTVEDPVEITLDGVKQVQVNVRAGLTFASALRAFLRSDPDVVLVGEIRDTETAKIAAEASLTGHLVLSSIHTNDAVSTPLRLLEMGVEPFLVASAVQAVVAQRLARRLCDRCKAEFKPSDEELRSAGWDRDRLLEGERPFFYRAVGCAACGGTGYRGRIALHEVLPVTEELSHLIGSRASVTELRAVAALQGMTPIREDGLVKAAHGLTSVEEVARVLV